MSKYTNRFLPVFSFLLLVLTTGCFKDKLTKTYAIMYPVYEDKATVLSSINSKASHPVENPGKIYLYGKYIFLNEVNKGVHVIDNSNPSAPTEVSFIKIPGNIDIAVRGDILYADLYTDLLAIDISNPLQAKLTKMVDDIFPERQYENGFNPDPSKVIVDWIKKDTTVEVERNILGGIWGNCRTCAFALASSDAGGGKSSNVPGVAGSMSRFALVGDYMYAVNRSALQTLSILNPENPQFLDTRPMGWDIETIYPFRDKLFIGSATGMFIYSIGNPSQPQMEGSFSHARACDPVVADDKYAFVTLRAGTVCEGTSNQLDVIDVTNVNQPRLVKTYGLTNPYGLSKDGNHLFVCDGKDGLKIYDATSPGSLKQLHHFKGYETFDAIAWNKRLYLVAQDGLYQYDYSDISNLKQLSKISIRRN